MYKDKRQNTFPQSAAISLKFIIKDDASVSTAILHSWWAAWQLAIIKHLTYSNQEEIKIKNKKRACSQVKLTLFLLVLSGQAPVPHQSDIPNRLGLETRGYLAVDPRQSVAGWGEILWKHIAMLNIQVHKMIHIRQYGWHKDSVYSFPNVSTINAFFNGIFLVESELTSAWE